MSLNIVINPLKIIFLLFIMASCSTLVEDENMNKNNVIYKIRSIDSNFINLETLLFVDIDTQSLLHIKKGTVLKQYSISSSYYGTGSRENSFKTPLGRHEIYKKIGNDLPNNAILKGRVWNGAIADIIVDKEENCFPMIQSGSAHNEMVLNKNQKQDSKSAEKG